MLLEDRRMLANFMVTSTADAGPGTLREAILTSVSNGVGIDLIQFSPTIDGGTINLTSFVNDVTAGSTMAGPSAFFINANTSLVIDGFTGLSQGITIARNSASAFRLFDVPAGSSLTLQSLTLSNGLAQGFAGGTAYYGGGGGGSAGLGGAIFNQGSLTILNSTLSGNTAQGGAGGTTGFGAARYGGGGGAGLGAAGATVTDQRQGSEGGGPNGGTRGTLTAGQPAGAGGFGGGGGGGAGAGGLSYSNYYDGASGGFGGGGGGGGRTRGRGGVGGFGGGAGASPAGANDIAGGYGGGNGGRKGNAGGGAGMGGAIFNNEGGVVTITNSTFTANAAIGGNRGVNGSQAYGATAGSGMGGGLFNRNGVVTITNSTFSANTVTNGDGASGKARGVFNLSHGGGKVGAVNITNSILGQAGATTIADFASANIGGNAPVNAGSNNLMSNAGNFPAGGVLVVANPLLGPLQSNGGLTKTMAPLAGSPAVDGALPAAAPKSDQRGMRRDPLPDIGAYEVRFVGSMIVNSAADEIAADEFLTLREAINLATGKASYATLSAAEKALATSVAGSLNTVTFASSVGGQTIALSTFENEVSTGSTMAGPSAFFIYQTSLLIDGKTGLSQGITITRDVNPASYAGGVVPDFRLFDVGLGSSLTLESLTLSNGRAEGFAGGNAAAAGGGGGSAGLGGAIFNQGSLTISNSTLTGNTAQGGAGGSFDAGIAAAGGGSGAGMGAPGAIATGNNGNAGGGPNGGVGGAAGSAGAAGGFAGGGGGGGKGALVNGAGGYGGFGAGGGGAGNLAGHGGRGGFGAGGGGASGIMGLGGYGGYGGGKGAGYAGKGSQRMGGGGGAGMGGAIFNEAGTVVITNSTFNGNAAIGGAGGTAPDGNGGAGDGMGGALFNHNGSVTVSSSTISGNTAADGGRGIFNLGERYEKTTASSSAIISISNSIIGQSDTSVSDLFIRRTGPPGTSQSTVSGSRNLIRTITTLAGSNTLTQTVNGDPMLGALANYGGLTPTMELLPGSAAIDAGDPGYFPPPNFDQRGAAFPRVVNDRVDIGAFEVQPIAPPSADFNGDGIVNGNDFLAWQRGFGIAAPNATKANGDADNDRDIDADDLAVWKAQFGTSPLVIAASGTVQASASGSATAFAAAAVVAEAASPVPSSFGDDDAGHAPAHAAFAAITGDASPLAKLTDQLIDAAMAGELIGRFPAQHQNEQQGEGRGRRNRDPAPLTTPSLQVAASAVNSRLRTLDDSLGDADGEDDAWRADEAGELLWFDRWSIEPERSDVRE